jgi:hypothetical protein
MRDSIGRLEPKEMQALGHYRSSLSADTGPPEPDR